MPEEEVSTPYLGKRAAPEPSTADQLEEMQRKIKKLEEELSKKDKLVNEL